MPRLSLIASILSLGALAACGPSAQAPSSNAAQNPAPDLTAESSALPASSAAPSPETAALLASLPAPYNTGDVEHGKATFGFCMACHTVQPPSGQTMIGPNLHSVFGRKAGTLAGYSYSDPMKAQTFTWDPAHLDTWLSGPAKMIPGTKMTFVGLPNPKDRIDVIAYLKVVSSGGS